MTLTVATPAEASAAAAAEANAPAASDAGDAGDAVRGNGPGGDTSGGGDGGGDQPPIWLVLDGDLAPPLCEALGGMVAAAGGDGGARRFCLESGERLRLPARLRLLFETSDAAHASPALLAQCRVLHVPPAAVGWRQLVKGWLAAEPNPNPNPNSNPNPIPNPNPSPNPSPNQAGSPPSLWCQRRASACCRSRTPTRTPTPDPNPNPNPIPLTLPRRVLQKWVEYAVDGVLSLMRKEARYLVITPNPNPSPNP